MTRTILPCGILLLALLAGCAGEVTDRSGATADDYAPEADYLAPAQRQAVEALKAAVREDATDDDNVDARLDTYWAWLNAMALRDGGLTFGPNMTAVVRVIRGDREGSNLLAEEFRERLDMDSVMVRMQLTRRLRNAYAQLDQFIRELELREESPAVFGRLTADVTGPFPAASYQTIRQTWEVGDRDLPEGGYLLIARHFMSDQGDYQIADPAADNYVTISSSNPAVTFAVDEAPMQGMHGGFRGAVDLLAFTVKEGTLTRGDTVTITYGDGSGGSRGFKVQAVSNDHYQLPVYVSFDGDHAAQYLLDLTPFEVVGGPVAGVTGFNPSVVAVAEPFTLSVRSEDRFFNRATGPIPAYRVLQAGKVVAETAAGEAIAKVGGLTLDAPGYYYFTIESADGTIRGESNPVRVQEAPAERIYWGETHGHGGFAEGQGSPEGYLRFARDDARLDFVTQSEHDIWLDDGEWEHLRRASAAFHAENEFVTYMGYEWSVDKFRGGHHNVLFRNRAGAQRAGSQDFPVLSMLYEALRARYKASDVLVIPHAHQTAYWRMSDPDLQNLAEIHSLHGYFEWFGQAYLAEGHRIGFIAASDDHLGHPGYNSVRPIGFVNRSGLAAVRAANKTTDAIFDALKQRATYATTIDRILLDAAADGVAMGGIVTADGPRRITAEAYGTAAIDSIVVVKNGTPIWSKDYRVHSRVDAEQTVEILFHSSSAPVGMVPDNPRGWRLWHGYLDIEGGEARGVRISNPNVHFPTTGIDPANPRRVHFATQTRGETERLQLRLAGVSAQTRITLHLSETREQPTAPATLRAPQLIGEQELILPFAELDRGVLKREIAVEEYVDTVTLKLVRDDAPRLQSIEVVDDTPARGGDSYYVRVEQANGGLAWSSPVFVEVAAQ